MLEPDGHHREPQPDRCRRLTEGLKPDGYVLINTRRRQPRSAHASTFNGPGLVRRRLKIAMEEFKRDIPSTMMIGVVCRATGMVNLDTVVHLTRERLGGKLRPEVVEANVRTLQRAFDEAVQG